MNEPMDVRLHQDLLSGHEWAFAFDSDNHDIATKWPEGWKVAKWWECRQHGHRNTTKEETEVLEALLARTRARVTTPVVTPSLQPSSDSTLDPWDEYCAFCQSELDA